MSAPLVVPIVTIRDAARAGDLAHALVDAGVRVVEVTLRTAAGLAAIDAIARVSGLQVAAGTVLTEEQVAQAVAVGARWIVSPGLDERVVDAARRRGALPVPGVATPTEVQRAVALGLDQLKLFPATTVGGLDALDAYAGPFPAVTFMPSGGLDDSTIGAYARHPSVFATSTSWATPGALIEAGDFGEISRRCRQLNAAVSA